MDDKGFREIEENIIRAMGVNVRRVENEVVMKLLKKSDDSDVPRDERVWKTAAGRTIWIAKMTDSHLKNTVRYYNRNPNKRITKQVAVWLIEELEARGFDAEEVLRG